MAARVSGTASPIGNGTMTHNITTMHNGTFIGTPAPFTGGTGVAKGCGAVVLTGLLVGGMVVAFNLEECGVETQKNCQIGGGAKILKHMIEETADERWEKRAKEELKARTLEEVQLMIMRLLSRKQLGQRT
ncbi:MAG: hypothetical protein ALECFALPRED_005232 [Alectoria fallacina]|uniref:Uncharacterized protein n=1 Tax=Alectoria fallacina TaxID=1903189 RepID=A0A8H3IXA3_9LECA|nr:MAG: hypothetical protein ALECFALPRED_005232 [Alectoria fallacina]